MNFFIFEHTCNVISRNSEHFPEEVSTSNVFRDQSIQVGGGGGEEGAPKQPKKKDDCVQKIGDKEIRTGCEVSSYEGKFDIVLRKWNRNLINLPVLSRVRLRTSPYTTTTAQLK